MRKISSIFLMAALVLALAFVTGCGDDDDDDESASTGTTTTEEAPAPSGESVGTIDVSLTDYKVDFPSGAISELGVHTLNVTNDGKVTHALEAEGPNGEVETEEIAPGDSAELEVDFQDGDYELYCPIGDHEDRGMKTSVLVSG
jgi:hypothetical protein